MSRTILVFYGSYRRDRQGIKLARWIVEALAARGDRAELVDAKAVDLPMLDRRHSDYGAGEAPAAMDALAEVIAVAAGFVFVTGEYNGGIQPSLKHLVYHVDRKTLRSAKEVGVPYDLRVSRYIQKKNKK